MARFVSTGLIMDEKIRSKLKLIHDLLIQIKKIQ